MLSLRDISVKECIKIIDKVKREIRGKDKSNKRNSVRN